MSKKYFQAMGQQAQAIGLKCTDNRTQRQAWPQWARQAYASGFFMQGNVSLRRRLAQRRGV